MSITSAPPGTPLSLSEASRYLCETDPLFALGHATIRGVEYPVFTAVPNNLRDLMQFCRPAHGGDGENDYLVYQEERWTYDNYCADVCRLAKALKDDFGVVNGTRVALAMRNYPEILITMMAIAAAGGVVVFLNGWWTTAELEYALEDSGARLIFADKERRERLDPLIGPLGLKLINVRDDAGNQTPFESLIDRETNPQWPTTEIDPEDDFAIMYSSGTTGHPKGVVQTHRGAISAVYSWWHTNLLLPLMAEPSDEPAPEPLPQTILIVTPLFHVTATHPMFLLSFPMGAKVVLMYRWDAEEAVRLIEKEQVTRFLGVPTQTAELLDAAKKAGTRLSTMSFLGSGGAKRPPAQVAELAGYFTDSAIASGWGMTETNAIGLGIFGADYEAKPDAAGRLYPPIQQLKILDDDGNTVPNGTVGELTVKSAANMRCYLNKPEATAEVLQDGWLRTGDLARVDDEGYVTIVDRKKNIIIRGGENIACLEVEAALHQHPSVQEASVFSVPDERLGESVGAAIHLRPGFDANGGELAEFLKDHLAKFKIPEHFWISHEPLLRGATDKTDRRAIRDKCLSEPGAPGQG